MIILAINEAMENGGNVLTYSEFLVFPGIWIFMVSIVGPSQKSGSCPLQLINLMVHLKE